MKIILLYDSPKNSNKFNKICKKYINWNQNSCFEGEISKSNLKSLKNELEKAKNDEDSIIIYEKVVFENKYIIKEKNKIDNFL